MLRLLRAGDLAVIAEVLSRARSLPTGVTDEAARAAIASVVEKGLVILRTEFTTESARGCVLAGRAAAGRDDPAIVAASLAALTARLLELS